jgi:hypothetical protein
MGVIDINRKRLISALAVTAALGLSAPAAAGAQTIGGNECSPSDVEYDPATGVLRCLSDPGGGAEDPADPSTAGLPFTGLDLAALGAAALGLLGGGVALRRLGRSAPEQR